MATPPPLPLREYCLHGRRNEMEIRFISSLTPDDENAFAPALLKAVGAVLDQFPIAYTLRIETTGTQVYQHTHPSFDTPMRPAAATAIPDGVRVRSV